MTRHILTNELCVIIRRVLSDVGICSNVGLGVIYGDSYRWTILGGLFGNILCLYVNKYYGKVESFIFHIDITNPEFRQLLSERLRLALI